MFRYLTMAVFCVMTGCASLTEYFKPATPLLPNTASLPCCWQVLEQLEIEFRGKQLTLSSVTAINAEQLTVVILDPLGRRVFAIIQQGNNVRVEKSNLIKEELPVDWLLVGVYLRYMPDDGWLFKGSHWHVNRDGEYNRLMQNNKTKVILFESIALDDTTVQLQYPDLKLNVNITTLLRQSLD